MRSNTVVKYTFTALGVCLFLGAFYFYQNTQIFLKDAITANGTIIDVERKAARSVKEKERRGAMRYRPVIAFKTQDGRLIEFKPQTSTNKQSHYRKGEGVEVIYKPSSPENASINSFFSLWGLPVVLGVLGTVFFGVGYSIIFFRNRLENKIEYLKKNGISIKAKFHSVVVNSSLKVNGKHPYQITAQWKDSNTSTLHTFKSENIWFDPSPHIKDENITVMIENNNPKKYHVVISFLPDAID